MAQFNPSDYLIKFKGKDYLEVKFRALWLRTEHPDALIETEPVHVNDQLALFKATVSIPGGGRATGHGSQTPAGFPEYIEKAETKAVGRALGLLGYGTQFCGDELDEPIRPDGSLGIVDAPVQRPTLVQQAQQRPAPAAPMRTFPVDQPPQGNPATEQQRRTIAAISHSIGFTKPGKDGTRMVSDYARIAQQFEIDPANASQDDAAALITAMKAYEANQAQHGEVPY